MKKVGIMTWYQHMNYGTSLQAVALQTIIKNMGYDAVGINYVSQIGHTRKTILEKIISFHFMKNKLRQLIRERKYKIRNIDNKYDAFQEFKDKHFIMDDLTQTSSELYFLNEKYDAFITGSDQIWTPLCFDSKYYLDFVDDSNKMISYAPSFGTNKIDNKYTKKEITYLLNRFTNISVREDSGAEIIAKLLPEKQVNVVLDPTLLLSGSEWDKFSNSLDDTSSEYILCYLLGDDEKKWRHVKRVAKHFNINVKIIPVFAKDYHRNFEIMNGIGPGEFLNLFKNASFVCTDSYHGMIFSIIYKKNFVAYKRFSDNAKNSQNSRVYSLLNKLGLEDRIITDYRHDYKFNLNIDYKKVDDKLEIERKKSILFLKNELNRCFFSNKTKLTKITNTCCGCGACKTICNHNAISIEINDKGFFEAKINDKLCVDCGLCRKVCPYNGKKARYIKSDTNLLYMLRSNSTNVLITSTSGGASFEITKYLNEKDYDVFGCTYLKNKCEAKHIKIGAGKTDLLGSIQGSKYIQSDTREIFDIILNSKKAVITGTPCQIAGMHNYLTMKKRRDDFILIDLICHGVPTKYLWRKYLEEGNSKYSYGMHPEVRFRNKEKGWSNLYIYIYGNRKKYEKISHKDIFYKYFMLQNCYMPSCYECNYRTRSFADIRIGDYWGNKYKRYWKTGASMVIGLTRDGNRIIEELKEKRKVTLVEEPISDYWNIQYPENPIIPLYYDSLLKDLKDNKFTLSEILKRNCRMENINLLLYNNYNHIKSLFRRRKR